MPADVLIARPGPAPIPTSLTAKLLNIFVSPGEVFDEIIEAPPRVANWILPTCLVCLTAVPLIKATVSQEEIALVAAKLVNAGTLTSAQAQTLSARWPIDSLLLVCFGTIGGTFCSALTLWSLGRFFLKCAFSFLKTLEVVGLTAMISVLGNIVTALLIVASGDNAARPALSLIAGKMDHGSAIHSVLDTVNLFHIWTIIVLAIGLSKLSSLTFKESAFWVFVWWVLVRFGLIILG